MAETKIDQNDLDPNAAEAWKLMMSSMIKFIHASTNLMNTYNKKARKTGQTESPKCETECVVCLPEKKSKCGVCAAVLTEQTKKLAESLTKTEKATESVTNTEKETTESVTNTEKETAESVTNTEKETAENEIETSETTAKDSGAPKSDTNTCVCAELREIKEQASKVGVSDCCCSGGLKRPGKCRKSSSKPKMCACPVGPKEKVEINNMMMEKINEAQKEIDLLRQELQKFQLVESAKNMPTAALYKEIMKESTIENSFLPQQALTQQKLPEANPYSQRGASYPRGPMNQPCVFASWTYEEDIAPAFGINEPGIETSKNLYQQIEEDNCICISSKRVPSPAPRPARTAYMPAIATSQPVTSLPSSFGARSDYLQNGSNVMEYVYQRPKKRPPSNTQYKPIRPSTDEQSAVKNLARSYQAGGFTYSQGAKQMTSGNICPYAANYDQQSRVNARNLDPSRMPSAGNKYDKGSRQSQRNNKEFDIYEVDNDDDEGCEYSCDDECEG